MTKHAISFLRKDNKYLIRDATQFDDIARRLMLVSAPILILLGTVGNLSSILILSRPTMRKMSVSALLTVLVSVDTLALYVTLLPYFIENLTGVRPRDTSLFACVFLVHIIVACRWCSSWIMVAVTSQQLLSVYCPIRARNINLPKTSWAASAVIGLTCTAATSHFWGNYHVKIETNKNISIINYCAKIDAHFLDIIWPRIDFAFGTLLPFLLILACDVALICWVISKRSNKKKSIINLTCMLLAVSFVCNILSLPRPIYFLGRPFWLKADDPNEKARAKLFLSVANILQGLNHATHFLVYCASGAAFRRQVKETLCRCHNRVDIVSNKGTGHAQART